MCRVATLRACCSLHAGTRTLAAILCDFGLFASQPHFDNTRLIYCSNLAGSRRSQNTQNGCECSTALPQPGVVPLVLLPATAAPRRLKPAPGRLARLLETSWWRGLDRFGRVFEAERFAMSSEPRCAALPRHSPSALDHRHSEHFRPTSETAEKRRYTPPATRRRGAEGAGRALVHVLTGLVSCGNTTCMLLIACWDAYPCSYFV